jgi:hypothetical protein
MTLNRARTVFTQIALVAFLALTTNSLFAQSQNLIYVETTETLSTTSQTPLPITGLSLTLPAVSTKYNAALVTLDMPNWFFNGTAVGHLAGQLSIVVGENTVATATGSCDTLSRGGSGAKATTLVVRVGLISNTQNVEAVWNGLHGGAVNMNQFGSLSAILVKD